MKTEKAKWLAAIFLSTMLSQVSTASWITDLILTNRAGVQQAPSPILIFPGLTGSRLQVKDSRELSGCLTVGYYDLWIDLARLSFLPGCSRRELKLEYDAATDTYNNHKGVTIRPVDFGGTKGIEYLVSRLLKKSQYFHKFVDYFVNTHNYQREKSIRAAPYDWRLAADELETRGYFDEVKTLVEEMYDDNGQQKVTIVGHSMGGPVSHHFLTRYSKITQEWKDKYIHAYVPLAGAWSGGNSALHAVISGVGGVLRGLPGSKWVSKYLAPLVNSLESTYWMMPRESVWKGTPLVLTPSKTYSAGDYEQLFEDLGNENGFAMYSGVLASSPDLPPPNVPTHCFYGVGTRTEKQFEYEDDFNGKAPLGKKPKICYGDGDGTVNIESSEVCLAWKSMPSKYPFKYKTFKGIDHLKIVLDESVFAEIANIAGATRDTFTF